MMINHDFLVRTMMISKIFVGYLNTFLLEMGEEVRKVSALTQWGSHSMRTCTYDEGGGSNFWYFGAYVLIE